MKAPLATIVIPLQRQPDAWLDRCVASALAQTAPVEVVVVVSDSTPDSNLAILERLKADHPSLRTVGRPGPGFADGLNAGIHAATAGRVGFLLADDWLDPTAVERCVPHHADIVSTQVSNFAEDGETRLGIERLITAETYERLESDQARASYLSHFYLFDKSALLRVGGVDPEIGETGADDYDLVWTLLENGATVHIVEEVLYYKRDHHGERLTLRDREAQIADLHKIFDKHGVHDPLRSELVEKHARWFGRPIHEVVAERRKRD